jgi:hypothetical protein
MDMPQQPNFTTLSKTEFAFKKGVGKCPNMSQQPNFTMLLKTEFAYEEGVAGAGEGVHGHAPAPELDSLVVELPLAAVLRGLKDESCNN